MHNAIITIVNDVVKVKERADAGDEIDANFIINTLTKYSQKDLHLLRDCIDFMIIYNNR